MALRLFERGFTLIHGRFAMRYQKSTACTSFAVLVVGVSLAAAQSERRRQFDVPCVLRPRKRCGPC
jgi:hypothetical protein